MTKWSARWMLAVGMALLSLFAVAVHPASADVGVSLEVAGDEDTVSDPPPGGSDLPGSRSSPGTLPFTGADVLHLLAVALVLLVTGGNLLRARSSAGQTERIATCSR